MPELIPISYQLFAGAVAALALLDKHFSSVGVSSGHGLSRLFFGPQPVGGDRGSLQRLEQCESRRRAQPNGGFTTFDAPGAGIGSYPGTGCSSDCLVSLNDWGAITGVYIDANNTYHVYLRSPEGKIVTVDPAGSTFTFPAGINDWGTIAGYYADANGVYHGFLRIPADE